jgi:hypothetical protein
MTVLAIFAELDLMPSLVVAKDFATLMLGDRLIIRGVTVEAVLLDAARHVITSKMSDDVRAKLKEWIEKNG